MVVLRFGGSDGFVLIVKFVVWFIMWIRKRLSLKVLFIFRLLRKFIMIIYVVFLRVLVFV